jgi:predicted nucleic acid-binding protein
VIVVVADTSGLLAALDDDHPAQRRAADVLQQAGTVVISPVLLGELDHVARRVLGRAAASAAIDDIRRWARAGRAVVAPIDADALDMAQSVRAQYADLDLDLADAINVAVAADYRTNAILTLDHRDFRAVRPLTRHEAFLLLPGDLP